MSGLSIGEPKVLLASKAEAPAVAPAPRTLRFQITAAMEAVGVFAACQFFLWRLSWTHRKLWFLILAYLIFSVWRRRDSLYELGLRPSRDLGASRWMALGVLVAGVPILAYGAVHGQVRIMLPDWEAILQFLGYTWWCVLQQFALQSFMHNRLLDASRSRHFSSLMLGVIFGSLHLPNPVLTIATFVGGIAMGEVFARYRNIYLLALGQAIVSTVLFVSFPDAWHHRLRVGPGYFRWGLTGLNH